MMERATPLYSHAERDEFAEPLVLCDMSRAIIVYELRIREVPPVEAAEFADKWIAWADEAEPKA